MRTNGYLINAHKELMCFAEIVPGLKLPEDGVNKHRNA